VRVDLGRPQRFTGLAVGGEDACAGEEASALVAEDELVADDGRRGACDVAGNARVVGELA
jgi:hypothetical protein